MDIYNLLSTNYKLTGHLKVT